MTDTQLYLAIGVPILFNAGMIVILIAYVNGRIDGINGRITSIESGLSARISSLEARMLSLENTFTTRFDLLMGRLTDLEREIHKG